MLRLAVMIVGALFILAGQGLGQESEPRLDFTLPSPENNIHQTYLGLSDGEKFSLGQIKAEMVIIEIFSMYCPVCQREAANVNVLFQLIQSSRELKDRVKLIGIGAGNSSFEVDFFREKYAIEFPLFSDSDFSIHKQIGQVRTPHFFALSLDGDGRFKVFFSQSSEVSDPNAFLKTLLEKSGSKVQP
jgi:peroxiredoxin